MKRKIRPIAVVIATVYLFILSGFIYAKTIEINFWNLMGSSGSGLYWDILQESIGIFNEIYKGRIHVTALPNLARDPAKLAVAVAGGVPPDVIQVDRFMVGSLASQGLLQSIDDLVKRDNINLDNFFLPTVKEAIYRDKLYGLPYHTDDRALVYNVDLFEEAGLDPKAPPKTWEEVDVYSRKIDLRNPNGTWKRVGFIPWWGYSDWIGLLWAAGGDILDETNTKVIWNREPGIKATEWVQSYIHRYGGWNIAFEPPIQRQHLACGVLGMIICGSWNVGEMKTLAPDIAYDVSPTPRPKGLEKEFTTWCGGYALSIPVGVTGEKRDAAWEFIKFYCGDERPQKLLGVKSGMIPALKSAAFSREFISLDVRLQKFLSLMQYGRIRPVVPSGAELSRIYRDKMYSLLSEDKLSARQIVDETARLGQIELDKGWQRAKVK